MYADHVTSKICMVTCSSHFPCISFHFLFMSFSFSMHFLFISLYGDLGTHSWLLFMPIWFYRLFFWFQTSIWIHLQRILLHFLLVSKRLQIQPKLYLQNLHLHQSLFGAPVGFVQYKGMEMEGHDMTGNNKEMKGTSKEHERQGTEIEGKYPYTRSNPPQSWTTLFSTLRIMHFVEGANFIYCPFINHCSTSNSRRSHLGKRQLR